MQARKENGTQNDEWVTVWVDVAKKTFTFSSVHKLSQCSIRL